MRPPRRPLVAALLAVALLPLWNCTYRLERRLVTPDRAAGLDPALPYLKAHLRDGGVYVFESWQADAGGSQITGTAARYAPDRTLLGTGALSLSIDSVALFETNVVKRSGASTALTVMFGVTAMVGVYCAANPKACFGSCPTFYAPDGQGRSTLQAEGFSASIAPALEAADLDMLYAARPVDGVLSLRLTNEALETHVIRSADVVALPRPANGRVFATPGGRFRAATDITPPAHCRAAGGDCRAAVRAFDDSMRWSPADPTDLARRELIELEFSTVPTGDLGLVIASRQTLMTTFLVYQALAWLGRDAARWLAALEPGPGTAAAGVGRALGSIDVLVENAAGEWVKAGSAGEVGPLATDTKLVPLPHGSPGPLRVRLRLTRGLWRIDYIALAAIGPEIAPRRIAPSAALRDGAADTAALHALTDTTRTLVTLPGDEYELRYRLSTGSAPHELFLLSRGYYLEWMRDEWLAEENPALAARMLFDPAGSLRALAPAFKAQESASEAVFWGSRYVRR